MNNAITTKQKAHKLLEDQGFNYITDLPYTTTFTGFDFYIGINDKENKAGIVALMDDEENYFLCKEDVKEMAVTARIQGIKEVVLYTDFGLELHSKHETPKTVGLDRICKLTGWEFGSHVLFASDNGGFITMGETTTELQDQKKEETEPEINAPLQLLQNAANNNGLEVHKEVNQDKRKKIQRYFVTKNGTTISPVLEYSEMNHFILGYNKAVSIMGKALQNLL